MWLFKKEDSNADKFQKMFANYCLEVKTDRQVLNQKQKDLAGLKEQLELLRKDISFTEQEILLKKEILKEIMKKRKKLLWIARFSVLKIPRSKAAQIY